MKQNKTKNINDRHDQKSNCTNSERFNDEAYTYVSYLSIYRSIHLCTQHCFSRAGNTQGHSEIPTNPAAFFDVFRHAGWQAGKAFY